MLSLEARRDWPGADAVRRSPSVGSPGAPLPRIAVAMQPQPSPWTLAGRRAIVTGATKGIGRATAHELLRLHATVLAVARTAADVEAAVAEWRALGLLHAHGLAADASTPAGIAAILAAARVQLGGLDLLVANVGTNVRRAAVEYETGEFAQLFRTNVESAFELARAAHPLLAAGTAPAVVLVGSVAASAYVGSGVPYAATKAALADRKSTRL